MSEKRLARIAERYNNNTRTILSAAFQLFSTKGFEKTSMEDIRQLSGVSKPTLYNHFKSKKDLFKETLEGILLDEPDIVYTEFDETAAIDEELKAFGERYLEYYINSNFINFFRMVISESNNHDILRDAYDNHFISRWKGVADYLERKLPADRLLDGGSWVAAMHLKGLLDSDAILAKLLGYRETITKSEIKSRVTHVVVVFCRAYCTS